MFRFDDFNLTTWFGNIASVGAIFSTMLGWAPPIAALMALMWYAIQINESRTVVRWRARRILLNEAKVLARAKVAAAETQAKILVDAAKADAASVLRAAATG